MKIATIFVCAILVMAVKSKELTPFEYFYESLTHLAQAFVYDLFNGAEPIPIDAYKTIPELIMSAGYQVEIHKVKTEDDYINTAWRITGKIGSKDTTEPEKKPPVILQHGSGEDAASYLAMNKSNSLPLLLSDSGYDVWLTNTRGNIFSYEHMDIVNHSVKVSSSDYFRYTFDEMAKYDVSEYIDYILDRSDHQKLSYVGASQGTTIFFAAADVVENLSDKVSAFVAYAPVVYVSNINNPFYWVLSRLHLNDISMFFKNYNSGVKPEMVNSNMRWASARFPTFFARLEQLIFGVHDDIKLDIQRLPVLFTHMPGGGSLFNSIHYQQMYFSGEFKMFDFGSPEENMKHYGQDTPPFYNTDRIRDTFSKVPSLLMVGEDDSIVRPKDLERLEKMLEGTLSKTVIIEGYNHANYGLATDCKQKVLEPTIDFIKSHTKQ